MNQGQRSYKT